MIDAYKRKINYLRLSVTDRCNLRCRYCMPATGVIPKQRQEILSYEELYRIAKISVSLGIEKIRVTGGEPLVRKGIVEFLTRLSGIPGLRQLVLTTNGQLLEEMSEDLRAAGVKRVNVSLDSLNANMFSKITRGGELSRTLAGIAAAHQSGLQVKLNVVVMRGVNDMELYDFVAMALDQSLAVRFIEYMPAVEDENWQRYVVPGKEIVERISARYPLQEVPRQRLSGPSRDYRIDGVTGTVGIITPVFDHFCNDCNRIRVTAAGQVKTCLFSNCGFDLKPYLQSSNEN
ncbi:MAG: GTP 3',8-cyclase MoaA, partial [Desulfuromonadales bacterium]|nr:GTP 3',8-cyclase MoaA [Desulfuromonadales bacterium]